MIPRRLTFFPLGILFFLQLGCPSGCPSKPPGGYQRGLPSSLDLGSYNINGITYRINRTIIHTHSPFSYDACDKKPNDINTGFKNESCLASFRKSKCENRIDTVFMTDHPKNMEDFEFEELILNRGVDEALPLGLDTPYLNKMIGCANSQTPIYSVGFESNLIGIGLKSHWGDDSATRSGNYMKEMVVDPKNPGSYLLDDPKAFRKTDDYVVDSEALITIPHPEQAKWTTQSINTIMPDGIEIYNFHANVSPKIRRSDVGAPPLYHVANILTYIIDPFGELVPDFGFIHFLEIYPIHMAKWNALLVQYLNDTANPPTTPKVFGYGATDSHENIFPQKVSDGERYDSHGRMVHMMSNHFLTPMPTGSDLDDFDQLKSNIKKGQGWVVFEGFGSPVNMNFYANQPGISSDIYLPGSELSLSSGAIDLFVQLPTLHPSSPSSGTKKPEYPVITMKLIRIFGDGPAGGVPLSVSEFTVKKTVGASLHYTVDVDQPGAYRVEIEIQPKHLRRFLSNFHHKADRGFPWILTNPIYIRP